eukprot:TRINITY_DN1049_c0_g1_i1.p1 TRINITY_DN1049_c0_g1~~TRINITY_DN1049_c0_g1_i1.p1  ORF type:complete len:294 (+),score=124.18 TRINITY_DN1049_c0_g1_i1:218-1099(+)
MDKEAEFVWKSAQKFIELDVNKKKEGTELDEFMAHKFLESLGETLTVMQLREKLRKIDLDQNGKMALLEYFAFRFNKTVKDILDSPQGDNTEEVNKAQEKVTSAQAALSELQKQQEVQQKALDDQKQAQQKQAEALENLRKSEAELKAAIDDLQAQEAAYANQIKTLEDKSKDPSAGAVTKNKAAAELAQLKQTDPLPLRKAKITQEAALRKVEKERKAADETAAALEARTRELEEQTRKVEAAVKDAEEQFKAAADYLEEVKRKGGVPLGSIWWMERELQEAQKYMPKKKQK